MTYVCHRCGKPSHGDYRFCETPTTWLDSLSLTSAPIDHRLRYRALCDMRARAHVLVLSCPDPDEAWRHAVQLLDVMVRDADAYLRLR